MIKVMKATSKVANVFAMKYGVDKFLAFSFALIFLAIVTEFKVTTFRRTISFIVWVYSY